MIVTNILKNIRYIKKLFRLKVILKFFNENSYLSLTILVILKRFKNNILFLLRIS